MARRKKTSKRYVFFFFLFFIDCFYPRKLPQHCKEDGMKVEKTRVSVNVFKIRKKQRKNSRGREKWKALVRTDGGADEKIERLNPAFWLDGGRELPGTERKVVGTVLISDARCSSTPAPVSLSLSDSVAFLSSTTSNSGRFDGLFARSCH